MRSSRFWIKLLCCCVMFGVALVAGNFRSSGNRRTAPVEPDEITAAAPRQAEKNGGDAKKSGDAKKDMPKADAASLRDRVFKPSKDKTPEDWAAQDGDSTGCISCHSGTESTHADPGGKLLTITQREVKGIPKGDVGCVYCHGGNGELMKPANAEQGSKEYDKVRDSAHVQPKYPKVWSKKGKYSSANPEQNYTLLLKESREFVRFINPGDLRVADITCGECHNTAGEGHTAQIVEKVRSSMMTHGGMLWGAALYNNGAWRVKNTQWGESYDEEGRPERLYTVPAPTPEEVRTKGIMPYMNPLLRWEVSQPGNILRVFERGGRKQPEVGNPLPEEDPGLPEVKLSPRGFGTGLRTDPVFLGLQKTRLLDPLTSMMGTNDNPGDYRHSGCTTCHTPYANDRSPVHSAQYAKYGHEGKSFTADPTIPKNESGHPIKHRLTNAIPTSQCLVCHMHPGTNLVTTYGGFMWWDNETDSEKLYPADGPNHTPEEMENLRLRNPEGSALRGKWGDPEFLKNMSDLNPELTRTQFADYHGHGWVFRAIFKQDRKGNLLDADDNIIPQVDGKMMKEAVDYTSEGVEVNKKSTRQGKPVHLKDIHLEKGMHCVDCHFAQDGHGNGKLYGEPRAAIEVSCEDCHGTIYAKTNPKAKTTGFAGGERNNTSNSLDNYKVRVSYDRQMKPLPEGRYRRASVIEVPTAGDYKGKVIQFSMLDPKKFWEVVQTIDSITPGNPHYSEKSHYAKTLMKGGEDWSPDRKVSQTDESKLAHSNDKMTCYTCHSSWMTSCFGCHLPMVANQKRRMQHNEGEPETRNWTNYNYQVLRDDVYMLGIDGTATGNRIAPVRSSSALVVGSQNANRQWLYSQQQTISSEGYSGQAMNTHVPHTVRAKETKTCTDCHVSAKNDNNAIMSQLLLLGTNYVNFMGRFVYVAEGHHGFSAVAVTERDEPQAVLGSTLHENAYPKEFKKFVSGGRELHESYHHHAEALSIQMRGEYVYVAEGEHGVHVYDIANVDNKDFSERITSAPVSPLGQKFYIKTKHATAIASPTTLGVDPTRSHLPENEEQPVSAVYAFLYASDKEEGLVVIGDKITVDDKGVRGGVATLLDGDPTNNFLQRQPGFNPNGILTGAENITVAGNYAYIVCDRGLVIVDVSNPLAPKVAAEVGGFDHPKAVAIQFRYAFVTDKQGLKVVDVTVPEKAKLVQNAFVPLEDAHQLYLARTYAYVAGGKQGLVIVDIEHPESPKLDQVYNAGGAINDAHDVKVGMTNASAFAYVADGKNGLRIIQLTSPRTMATNFGFSPRPQPMLIATHKTKGESLAISKGLDRDRGVDESGNQLVVFGRRGARPFTLAEMRRLYMRENGEVYKVSNEVPNPRRASLGDSMKGLLGNVALFGGVGLVGLVVLLLPFVMRRNG